MGSGPETWLQPTRLCTILLLLRAICIEAFLGDLLGSLFGDGGSPDDDPGVRAGFTWPDDLPTTIEKRFDWLRGTVWAWNGRVNVQLQEDGNFEAPTEECSNRECRWSASGGRVYINFGGPKGRGSRGTHKMKVLGPFPTKREHHHLAKVRLDGARTSDGAESEAEFVKILPRADAVENDLYQVLGLSADASAEDIKKAYRKLSVKYHPDKNPDEESKHIFASVRDAYEILNDPVKKILFDTGGVEALQEHEKGEIREGADMDADMTVTLENVYTGKLNQVEMKRRVVCPRCSKEPKSPKCAGCGKCPDEIRTVNVQVGPGMYMQDEQPFPSKERCKRQSESLDVQVEKGTFDGERVIFPLMGDQAPKMLPGSVNVAIKVQKHRKFKRKGDDLHMDIQVSLQESLMGWERTIRHLDGHKITVGSSSVTKPMQVMRIKGEGMPLRDDPASYGDLFLMVEVAFPVQLTEEQRNAIGGIFPPTGGEREIM